MTQGQDSPISEVQAILWDMDGTLVRTEHLHWELERALLEQVGVSIEHAAWESFIGRRTREVLQELLVSAGKGDLLDEVMALRSQAVQEQIVERADPVEGIDTVLHDSRLRRYRFALVTSTERHIATAVLERFQWASRFEIVVAGDDVTAGKPAPTPYLEACRRLQLRPHETLVVEDSINGVEAGVAAGCHVAALVGTEKSAQLRRAHHILTTPGDLLRLLGAQV